MRGNFTVTQPPLGRGPYRAPLPPPQAWTPEPFRGAQYGQPQTPFVGPRFGYQTGFSQPKRSSKPLVAVVMIIAAILGVTAIGFVALTRHHRSADTGYSAPLPTTRSSITPLTPSSSWQSTTPTTTSRLTPTSYSSPVVTTESSPAVQQPAGPVSVPKLGDNPINTAGLGAPKVTCNLPRFALDPQSQDRFYRAALVCLNTSWRPVLAQANLPFREPRLLTITSDTNTPCGTFSASDTAQYCGSDETLYMTANYYANVEQIGAYPGKFLGIIAHEYGHHIQQLSGALGAAWSQRYDAGATSPTGLLISHRVELQATCYGGMFMAAAWNGGGSVNDTLINEALTDEAQRGDYPGRSKVLDHGTPEHNGAWMNQGYKYNRITECNTWLSPDDQVS